MKIHGGAWLTINPLPYSSIRQMIKYSHYLLSFINLVIIPLTFQFLKTHKQRWNNKRCCAEWKGCNWGLLQDLLSHGVSKAAPRAQPQTSWNHKFLLVKIVRYCLLKMKIPLLGRLTYFVISVEKQIEWRKA